MYVADTLGSKPLHDEVMPIRKYPLLGGTYRRAIDCNLSNGQVRPLNVSALCDLNKFRYEYDSMPHLACESRDYQVGNGSLTGNSQGTLCE